MLFFLYYTEGDLSKSCVIFEDFLSTQNLRTPTLRVNNVVPTSEVRLELIAEN